MIYENGKPIEAYPAQVQLSKANTDWAISLTPYRPPATADDAIARQAVAEIEREEGYDRCAQHRLHGAYDGDTEHKIALAAIRLMRAQTNSTTGRSAAQEAAPVNNG